MDASWWVSPSPTDPASHAAAPAPSSSCPVARAAQPARRRRPRHYRASPSRAIRASSAQAGPPPHHRPARERPAREYTVSGPSQRIAQLTHPGEGLGEEIPRLIYLAARHGSAAEKDQAHADRQRSSRSPPMRRASCERSGGLRIARAVRQLFGELRQAGGLRAVALLPAGVQASPDVSRLPTSRARP